MKLHDYIGNLVSSIQHARVNADLQAVRVAETYAKHELLEHFPVPRMRLKDVEMTIPVAIDVGQVAKSTNLEPVDNREFNAATYKEVLASLGRKSLPKAESRQVRQVISEQSALLERELLIGGETQALKNFSQTVAKAVVENQLSDEDERESKKLTATIADRLNSNLASALKPVNTESTLDQLEVTIEADILREKPPESLLSIKLVIQEEGVEWHRMEAKDGKISRKLIPE
ncbi:MAG TPA: hypothetical protein VIC26_14415 [Marinagarivorans sp.]